MPATRNASSAPTYAAPGRDGNRMALGLGVCAYSLPDMPGKRCAGRATGPSRAAARYHQAAFLQHVCRAAGGGRCGASVPTKSAPACNGGLGWRGRAPSFFRAAQAHVLDMPGKQLREKKIQRAKFPRSGQDLGGSRLNPTHTAVAPHAQQSQLQLRNLPCCVAVWECKRQRAGHNHTPFCAWQKLAHVHRDVPLHQDMDGPAATPAKQPRRASRPNVPPGGGRKRAAYARLPEHPQLLGTTGNAPLPFPAQGALQWPRLAPHGEPLRHLPGRPCAAAAALQQLRHLLQGPRPLRATCFPQLLRKKGGGPTPQAAYPMLHSRQCKHVVARTCKVGANQPQPARLHTPRKCDKAKCRGALPGSCRTCRRCAHPSPPGHLHVLPCRPEHVHRGLKPGRATELREVAAKACRQKGRAHYEERRLQPTAGP